MRCPFPLACRGKGSFRALPESPGSPRRECSRWPFHPARRGKGYFRALPEGPGSRTNTRRAPAMAFLLLPVKEKAIMGFGACLRWPFPPACRGKKEVDQILVHLRERKSGHLCALAMGFPPCLSRKRPSHGLVLGLAAAGLAWLGPGSTPGDSPGSSKQIRAAEGSSGMLCSPSSHGLDILSSPSSHVMCTCDGRSIIRVR